MKKNEDFLENISARPASGFLAEARLVLAQFSLRNKGGVIPKNQKKVVVPSALPHSGFPPKVRSHCSEYTQIFLR